MMPKELPATLDVLAVKTFDCFVFLLSVLLFYPIGLLIFTFYPQPNPEIAIAFADWTRVVLAPEGAERMVYVVGLCYLLLVPALLSKALARFFPKFVLLFRNQYRNRFLIWCVALSLGLIVWVGLVFARAIKKYKFLPLFFSGLLLSHIVSRCLLNSRRLHSELDGSLKYYLVGAVILILVFASGLLLINEQLLLFEPAILASFPVLLGTINQVLHGHTVLVDLPSQYGILYPYLCAFAVKIFGSSVLLVSAFFVLLSFFSLLFIPLAIYRKMGVSIFSFFLAIAVVGLAHPFFYAALFNFDPYQLAPYYASMPIRIIFGAFMVFFTKLYLDDPTLKKYMLGAALSGLSVLWNIDTGVVISLSWLALLFFKTLSEKSVSPKTALILLKHVCCVLLAVLLAAAMYSVYAKARSGYFPQWGDSLRYQSIFYKAGFMMLRMKLFNLWQIPVLLYSVVIFMAVKRLIARGASLSDNWYFYLAVYGLGIFAYYQGRSHFYCLLSVLYPAALLGAFIAYDLVRSYNNDEEDGKDNAPRVRNLCVMKLTVLLLPFLMCLLSSVRTIGYMRTLCSTFGEASISEKFSDAIDFVKSRASLGRTLVLSDNAEAIYFIADVASPLPFASLLEVILSEDVARVQKLLDNTEIDHVLVGEGVNPLVKSLSFANYRQVRQIKGFVVYSKILPLK